MGNIPSIQKINSDLEIGKQIQINKRFFIKRTSFDIQYVNVYNLYYIHNNGRHVHFHNFQTQNPLAKFSVSVNPQIVKFVFKTNSSQIVKFAFDFLNVWDKDYVFGQSPTPMPVLLPSDLKITHLECRFSYYSTKRNNTYYFHIVKSPDGTCRGSESTFQQGDTVVDTISVFSRDSPVLSKCVGLKFTITNTLPNFSSLERTLSVNLNHYLDASLNVVNNYVVGPDPGLIVYLDH